ncbi:MAG: hypothetical protein HAW60_06065 [Bdellovibrionales bacterium]|nr:hypothetical protein [Bdellovibrionales bacterium]
MESLLKLNKNSRLQWILRNFINCKVDFIKAKKFKIVMDLATTNQCSLTQETVKTCFLGRGFQQYSINID